jgi:hypothetical protein
VNEVAEHVHVAMANVNEVGEPVHVSMANMNEVAELVHVPMANVNWDAELVRVPMANVGISLEIDVTRRREDAKNQQPVSGNVPLGAATCLRSPRIRTG